MQSFVVDLQSLPVVKDDDAVRKRLEEAFVVRFEFLELQERVERLSPDLLCVTNERNRDQPRSSFQQNVEKN